MSKPVSIIVPVYGDWESLSDCIESLKKHVDKKHSIFFVNDCGPDADIIEANIKKAISGQLNMRYSRNKKNLGFLQNCNQAVDHLATKESDILLLNSDTKVTAGFLESMQKTLYATDKMAAVSPRSNNATIATVPLYSINKKGINPKRSFELFQKIKNKLPEYSIAPTAHGFCMLIRGELIKKYGLFDPIFGQGYGEEVDFCQRMRKKDYTCAYANRAYVFHLEARSFSLEKKAVMLEENNKIIRKRYPNYQQEVREYIARTTAEEDSVIKTVNGIFTRFFRKATAVLGKY